MIAASTLAALIGSGRYDLTDEKRCQADIATLLATENVAFRREHRLGPGDIPDFLVEGVFAIEVKMGRSGPSAVERQLRRYAAYPQVSDVILVSNKAMALPDDLDGVPLICVSLGRAWL
jgi:RecB family endonuclease NucS